MFITVWYCTFWGLFLPLLHLIMYPVQEWSGSWRQFRFCFGVRIRLIVFNNESFRVLCVHNGSPRSIVHQFISCPLLRRPSFINIPFWVAWWVCAYNGSLRSIVLLSLRTQRRLTFVSEFPRAFWCSRGKHVRIPHAVSRDQIHRRLRFCCDTFFTWIFCAFFSTFLQNNLKNWNG